VFFIDCRQSRSGMMNSFTSVTRNRLRRRMNGNTSEWLSAVDGLPNIHRRLSRVFIENMNAIELIDREDTPNTLFYCDPPYLHETRTAPDAYAHEMNESQHQELLAALVACKGKVMLSGYPSSLYDVTLRNWSRHTFELPNNAAGGETKRRMTEVLWCNF
jgi:DNA adenine methylase